MTKAHPDTSRDFIDSWAAARWRLCLPRQRTRPAPRGPAVTGGQATPKLRRLLSRGARDDHDELVPRLVAPHLPVDALRGVAQPTLNADRIMLRPWRQEDASFVQDAFSVPDLQRWHFMRMDELAEAERWIDAWLERWTAGTDASWAVCAPSKTAGVDSGPVSPDAGQPVGYVGLRDINLGAGAAQVSYWVVPSARGKGIAALATRRVVGWAFEQLGLHRVWLMHSTENPASCAVAQRAGFLPEGTFREHLLHADGWHDMHIHGRLAQDR